MTGGASKRTMETACCFSGGSGGKPLGAALAVASPVLTAAFSPDFEVAAAGVFDSLSVVVTAGGVGEGDEAAISFGSGVGVCAGAADAKVSTAAHSRAISVGVFIYIYPVGGRPLGASYRYCSSAFGLKSLRRLHPRSAEGDGRGTQLPRPTTAGGGRRATV